MLDCGKPPCIIKIQFSSNIPEIDMNAFDVYIDTTMDINKDGANEILLYEWWVQCCWINISVYSFNEKEWKCLAKTEAFVDDNDSYINRVTKKGNNYFLIGDKWRKDNAGTYKTKTRIKTK